MVTEENTYILVWVGHLSVVITLVCLLIHLVPLLIEMAIVVLSAIYKYYPLSVDTIIIILILILMLFVVEPLMSILLVPSVVYSRSMKEHTCIIFLVLN